MSEASLRAMTQETVDNYRQVAEHAISAYRAGGHRLLGLMSRNVERATQRGAERLAPRLAAAVRRTSHKVTGAAAKGIDAVSARSEQVVEASSAGVGQQLGRVADFVEGLEIRYLAGGLQAAARVSLSSARAALSLSEKLMAGAERFTGPVVAPKAARRAPVRRAAKKVVRSAAKPAKKAARARRAA
ncbi:MAG: hypothetical protein U1F50_06280 [Rubrivivax sp.]